MAAMLSEYLTPVPSFSRSAQLERDLDDAGVLEHYYPTPRATAFAARVLAAHAGETANSAWTLTGPYGSGKSSCALFLAGLLGEPGSACTKVAQKVLKAATGKAPPKTRGYVPCLVTARREPLGMAVARALLAGAERTWAGVRGRNPAFMEELQRLLESGDAPKSGVVLEKVQAALKAVQRRGFDGLLLVIDELGLALEYASSRPDRSDLEVLQLLAEMAHRPRAGEGRLIFVTILHQAFEDYARGMSQRERQEWAKVQGRFEDATLLDADLDCVRLVSRALERRWPTGLRGLVERWAGPWAKETEIVPLLGELGDEDSRARAIASAFPLDPIALAALPVLSRRFAQNGRTLFTFVASSDPHGLCAQAARLSVPKKLEELTCVSLPELYDFFVESQNLVSLRPADHALWCEVKDGVERCQALGIEDREELNELVRLVKVIAVLQLAFAAGAGVKAAAGTLQWALYGKSTEDTRTRLTKLLGFLTERGIVVYRRHTESYHIWRGSDFDVEAALADRRTSEDARASAVGFINRERLLPPIVAQRHYVETGTLRYFECLVAGVSDLGRVLAERDVGADGLLLLLLDDCRDPAPLTETYPELSQKNVLLSLPSSWRRIVELATDLVALTGLLSDRQRLKGDTTAQREIRTRLLELERQLREELDSCFDPEHAQYYRAGQRKKLRSRLDLRRELSVACEDYYPLTPRLHNDLINRRQLSSTSAAARTELLNRMLAHGTDERLGIEGYPPEACMYASLLEATGIHAVDPEVTLFPGTRPYQFGPPKEDLFPQLHTLWQELCSFMDGATGQAAPRTVGDVFDLMSAPPFGIKSGIQPVLFLACYLYRQHDVALYEDGTFVPSLTADVLERMVKKPHLFTLRRFGVAGLRAAIFNRFKALVGKADAPPTIKSLLLVVRPLLAFAQRLPDFTRRTKSLSKEALAVRETLFTSRDPEELLFEDLPQACGFEALGLKSDERAVQAFFGVLEAAMRELRDCYEQLLGNLRHVVFVAFGEDDRSVIRARRALGKRVDKVRKHIQDPQLSPLLLRVADTSLADQEWAEALAALVLNKPAALWDDHAVLAFEARIAELTRRYQHVERLVFEVERQRDSGDDAEGEALRLTVTRLNGTELDGIVRVSESDLEAHARLLETIKEELSTGDSRSRMALVAALAEWALREHKSPIPEREQA